MTPRADGPADGRWRVGISGSGFVARSVAAVLARTPDFAVAAVLTRRPVALSAPHFPDGVLTNSRDALIERADIVFECSGDTAHAAEVLCAAGAAGRHLVTLNAEAQVTVGTELLHRGFSVTEAYGDQPGALAELDEEVRAIGFEPVAYVNFKGFHDPDPSPESMRFWSQKQASTVRAVTSYTDGGKLQIEQVLVANGLNAGIARQGMIGGAVDDLLDLDHLALAAERLGRPVSDYIVHPKGPKGVLILATCEAAELTPDYSVFAKVRTRGGRAYMLLKPHYFVHLEVPKTLRRVVAGGAPLITNGRAPSALIAAVAKRAIPAGARIETALGGFELRGEAATIAGHEDAVPITLLDGARTRRAVEPGATIREADVEVPETLARALWRRTVTRVAEAGRATAWAEAPPATGAPAARQLLRHRLPPGASGAGGDRGGLRPDLAAARDPALRRRQPRRHLSGDAGDGRRLPRAAQGDPEPQPEEPRDHRPRRPDHGTDLRRLRRAERRRRRLGAGAHRSARRRLARLGAAAEGDPLGAGGGWTRPAACTRWSPTAGCSPT